jgi:hypothetical protein
MTAIYSDNGSARGMRTRYFREHAGALEWIYAVDHAGPNPRWYGASFARSIAEMERNGYTMTALEPINA